MGLTHLTRRPKITWVTHIRSIELGFAGVVELQRERWRSRRITQLTTSLTKHTRMASKSQRGTVTLQPKGYVFIHSHFSVFIQFFFFVNNNNNSLLLSIDYCRWILSFWGIRGTLGSTTRKMVKSPLLKND
jgi:hypothetical protein